MVTTQGLTHRAGAAKPSFRTQCWGCVEPSWGWGGQVGTVGTLYNNWAGQARHQISFLVSL